MAQPVQQHSFTTSRQRRHHGEVRHVTRGEQQRSFAPSEGGKLLFQPSVLSPVPRDEMRSTAARTAPLRAFAHCCRNRGIACEPQIIVAGEVDELPPVNNGGYPTAWLDERINRPPLTTQVLAI